MKSRRIVLLIVILLLSAPVILSAAGQNSAQKPIQDSRWDRVKRIAQRQKIAVQLQNGTKINGRFVEADDSRITLSAAGGKNETIAKEEVRRISRKARGRGALIGLGIGAGTGIAVGASKNITSEAGISRGASATIGGMMFGFFGTIIGAVIGVPQTLYDNPISAPINRK